MHIFSPITNKGPLKSAEKEEWPKECLMTKSPRKNLLEVGVNLLGFACIHHANMSV